MKATNQMVRVGNNELMQAVGISTLPVTIYPPGGNSFQVLLENVLYVPGIASNSPIHSNIECASGPACFFLLVINDDVVLWRDGVLTTMPECDTLLLMPGTRESMEAVISYYRHVHHSYQNMIQSRPSGS